MLNQDNYTVVAETSSGNRRAGSVVLAAGAVCGLQSRLHFSAWWKSLCSSRAENLINN